MNTLVHAVRNIRAEMQLPPSASSDVYVIGAMTDPSWICAQENRSILQALVKIDTLIFTEQEPLMTFSAETLVDSLKIMIPLPPEMREKEKQRLIKEQDKLSHQSTSMKEKLASPEFLQKAPAEVVNKLSSQLLQIDKQIAEMQEKYRLLSA
jgi:valyl-tRNA synthetase